MPKSKKAKPNRGKARPGTFGAVLDEIGTLPLGRRKVKAGVKQPRLRRSSPPGYVSERDLA